MKRTARDAEESNRSLNRRTLMLGGGMGAMVAVLGARMRYLQVEEADEFKLLAEENRISIRLIPPDRGLIRDRNGKLIAANEQNYRVVITREAAGDAELVLRRLATIIPSLFLRSTSFNFQTNPSRWQWLGSSSSSMTCASKIPLSASPERVSSRACNSCGRSSRAVGRKPAS